MFTSKGSHSATSTNERPLEADQFSFFAEGKLDSFDDLKFAQWFLTDGKMYALRSRSRWHVTGSPNFDTADS